MSTNDDCYIGAYNLMEFKQSDVSNENSAKSIVLFQESNLGFIE